MIQFKDKKEVYTVVFTVSMPREEEEVLFICLDGATITVSSLDRKLLPFKLVGFHHLREPKALNVKL